MPSSGATSTPAHSPFPRKDPPHPGQVVVGWDDDPGLALDRFQQHRDGVVVDGGGQRVGSTMSLTHSPASAWQNGASRSEWKARLTNAAASSWACAAATIRGWRWPKLTAEYAARQSRWRRPSTSVIRGFTTGVDIPDIERSESIVVLSNLTGRALT